VTPLPSIEEARAYLRVGTGRGVKVAVLDSGVEIAHPSLEKLRLADDEAVVDDQWQLKTVTGEGRDLFGHGTAIAGIIHETAPEADIGSFRVLGEQLRSRSLIIREGVRQALDRGYHILNCSFGCAREEHVLLYKDWIDEAYLRGHHIVAACNNQDFRKREWPGHFPTVITVNFGGSSTREELFYRPGSLVEFIALGIDVSVAWKGGGRRTVTGSSFAAAQMAGLLARLLSCCPSLTPLEAKALLHQAAMPWSPQSVNESVSH
jgi:subtilisin